MPTSENSTAPSKRVRFEELRPEEFLPAKVVEHLMHAAKNHGWYSHQDVSMSLNAHRHDLRVALFRTNRYRLSRTQT